MAKANDLFSGAAAAVEPPKPAARSARSAEAGYTAADIEVLEGLEPVRRRPGMYVGGTDEKALHHLFAEVIDNAMDEAVAGHATWIDVALDADGFLTVADNGRGIPVDQHPKFRDKSALEVIMTTLHAGGKFDSSVYETSGGLHGVGVSVVNALSERLEVEVARGQTLYRQIYERGRPMGPLEEIGRVVNRRGTRVRFKPDVQIFGPDLKLSPARLFRMARSRAYLFGGAEIRWSCAESLLEPGSPTPARAVLHFPGGLRDFLEASREGRSPVLEEVFAGRRGEAGRNGTVEWALAWFAEDEGFSHSYCNTISTPEGGTHEQGLRTALLKGLRNYAELAGNKRAGLITSEDLMVGCGALLSVFIREPEFQGQTKEKLSSAEATRIVETVLRDAFEHWLAETPSQANRLIEHFIERAEDRIRRRQEREVSRKTPTRRLRLPGKLADCTVQGARNTEIFIVEGDSAGGSAKQARDRATQAVLPLRGKILNVANAGRDKLAQNQQLADLVLALGCGTGARYTDADLRYQRVIIMTDADVDGAHIASLLITFFHREMPRLIANGHLFLAVPPLYRLSHGGTVLYARDDAHKDTLLRTAFKRGANVEIGRFKGLGEMMASQLKETTMDPKRRTLLRVAVDEGGEDRTRQTVERLMGNKPEMRFRFIQERAEFATDLDI